MNVESYLRQGNCLDQRIRYNLRKLADLRKTVADVSAPLPRPDNVVTSRNTDALFVRALERVEALEERISREILLQTSLRESRLEDKNPQEKTNDHHRNPLFPEGRPSGDAAQSARG